MIVTNVPGPQFGLYTVGAPMHGMYPLVPLLPGGGLGVALFSYDGKLCWGFNADHELVPDLDDFVADIATSFEELRNAVVSRFLERRTGAPERQEAGKAAEAPPEPQATSEADVEDEPLASLSVA